MAGGSGPATLSTSPQNDMWIAACCIRHEIPLATLNLKDFQDFADHDGLVLLRSPELRATARFAERRASATASLRIVPGRAPLAGSAIQYFIQ